MRPSAAPDEPVSGPPISQTGAGPVLDKFHLAALAFQRVKQLRNGARPRVEAGHKDARVALLEVMAGVISWDVVTAG